MLTLVNCSGLRVSVVDCVVPFPAAEMVPVRGDDTGSVVIAKLVEVPEPNMSLAGTETAGSLDERSAAPF